MNAAQMHLDFLEYIDEFSTTEVDEININTYLRWATEDIVDESYSPNDKRKRHKGLEKTQKVKSDLRTLLKKDAVSTGLSLTNNVLTLPEDYRYMARVDVKLTLSGKSVWRMGVLPKSQDWLSANIDGELVKKSLYYNPVYNENALGVELYVGNFRGYVPTISDVEIRYVKNPAVISKSESFSAGTVMTVGQVIHVDSGSVTYNGDVYNRLDTFTVVTGFLQFTGSGTASVIVNSDLPESLHIEIVRRAAMIYEGIMMEQTERNNIAEDEFSA